MGYVIELLPSQSSSPRLGHFNVSDLIENLCTSIHDCIFSTEAERQVLLGL